MGMFDSLTCERPLPDGFDGAGGFQTKDLDCNLEHFKITAAGLAAVDGDGVAGGEGAEGMSCPYCGARHETTNCPPLPPPPPGVIRPCPDCRHAPTRYSGTQS